MIPSSFILLDQLPLTINGKVDKKVLLSLDCGVDKAEIYAAPESALESQLQKIWQEVLVKKSIGIHDNFFDLGGHSLLAVRLFARIEKQLGKKLPVGLLFQFPTISQIANAMEAKEAIKPDSCLIPIQPNGSHPPMFWLHTLGGGGGGGVLRYQKLSQLLGPDQPSYGLVAPPEPFTSIELMAKHYISAMRAVQPVGPYYLGGYCFGGVVAFEMAQQLQARGETVALLALLDSAPANVAGIESSAKTIQLFSSFPKRLSRFFNQSPTQIAAALKRRGKKLERKLMMFAGRKNGETLSKKTVLEDVIDMSQYPKDYKRYAEVHWNALVNYFPKIYSGKIQLFQTTDSSANISPETIWKSLAGGGLDVKRISGTHEKMLDDPSVQVLAMKLKECLERCALPKVEARAA